MIEPFDDLMPLTGKQKAVLSTIHSYWANHNFYPTQRELAEHFESALQRFKTLSLSCEKRLFIKT